MKDAEICQTLIGLCRAEGATDVTASVSQGGQSMVRFSNSEVTVIDTLAHHSGSLFVNVSGRRASTSVVELDQASLRKTARKVVAIAKASPPASAYAALPKGPFTYDPHLLSSPRVGLDPDELVSRVEEAIAAGHKEGAERMAGSLIARDGEYTFATSGDVAASTEGGSLELSVRAFGRNGGSGASVSLSTSERDLRAVEAGAEAGSYARSSEGASQAAPGEMDAVMGPMVMASIINQVGRLSSAFYIDTGMTFLANRLGEEIGSKSFTLVDDPTLADSFGSVAFDAEGLPTQRNDIVDHGVLRTYLHNSTTASRYGVKSTANAGMIAPRPFNLVMEGGSGTTEDLVRSVDDGILVTNNWYLRYQNYSTGDFSTIPRDAMLRIKNGELAGPVRELRISDNIPRMLRNVDAVSRDRRWVRWWEVTIPALSPSAVVRRVRFTSSSQ